MKNRFCIIGIFALCALCVKAQVDIVNIGDTTRCLINYDTIEDYAILDDIGAIEMTSYKLTIGISIGIEKFKEYSWKLDHGPGLTNRPRITFLYDYIMIGYTYDRTMSKYSYEIYKYIKKLDNWYYYGAYTEEWVADFQERSRNGWEYPYLMGSNLYNDNLSREVWNDSIRILIPDIKDSIIHKFNKDYDIYLGEFKSKLYDKIYSHDMYRSLDYLNYVEINKSTVQKYNDIGFFLLESGNCQQSIYILENVVYKFPQRTVAYLNLGDAYYCNNNSGEAIEMYQKYIELMKANGKESRIPKRIWDRIKDK